VAWARVEPEQLGTGVQKVDKLGKQEPMDVDSVFA